MGLTHEAGIQDYFLIFVEKFKVSIFDLGQSVNVNAALTNHFVFCFAEEQRCRRQRWLWRFWLSQQVAGCGTLAAFSSLFYKKVAFLNPRIQWNRSSCACRMRTGCPGQTGWKKNQKLFIPLTDFPDWYTWKQCSGKASFLRKSWTAGYLNCSLNNVFIMFTWKIVF